MLKIHLQLYSILREKLPPESNGQAELQLKDGANLQNLFVRAFSKILLANLRKSGQGQGGW